MYRKVICKQIWFLFGTPFLVVPVSCFQLDKCCTDKCVCAVSSTDENIDIVAIYSKWNMFCILVSLWFFCVMICLAKGRFSLQGGDLKNDQSANESRNSVCETSWLTLTLKGVEKNGTGMAVCQLIVVLLRSSINVVTGTSYYKCCIQTCSVQSHYCVISLRYSYTFFFTVNSPLPNLFLYVRV
jgi:hypothetical protein